MRQVDVLALVAGLLLTGIAAVALWVAVAGSINWQAVQIAAPLVLIVAGMVGLAMSRNHD